MSFTTGGIGTDGPWAQWSGNGVADEFTLNHKIYAQGDIVVLLTVDATSVTTIQTLTTHYTVADVAEDAHDNTVPTITMLTPPATGETLTIYRQVALIQNTNFLTTQFWQSLSAEQQIDLIVMMMQWFYVTVYKRGSFYAVENTTTPLSLEALMLQTGAAALHSLTGKGTLVGADELHISDSADSWDEKKITATVLSTYLGTSLNGVYALLAGIAGGQTLKGGTLTTQDLTLMDNAVDGNSVTVSNLKGMQEDEIEAIFDDGGSVLTTGARKMYVKMKHSGTITSATLVADVSGSIVIDIWKDSYANFPPTVADTIVASAPPTLSGAQKSEDITLTGWTKTFAKGDWLEFNINSVATITKATLSLQYTITGI